MAGCHFTNRWSPRVGAVGVPYVGIEELVPSPIGGVVEQAVASTPSSPVATVARANVSVHLTCLLGAEDPR